jgi:hypothetical protein
MDAIPNAVGCDGCQGLTQKSCEVCEEAKAGAIPCAICYPDRNFRWAALKTFETGIVPGRFERNEFCGDCLSFLCECGTPDSVYEEAIFEYLEQVAPGWVRPVAEEEEKESPFDLKAWTLSQIAEAEWRASYNCSRPHPLRNELSHQTVIKGVSFCNSCWRTLASTASGCICDPEESSRILRHEAAMEFMNA